MRILIRLALLGGCLVGTWSGAEWFTAPSWGQVESPSATSQLTQITADAQGRLIFQLTGEGWDPSFSSISSPSPSPGDPPHVLVISGQGLTLTAALQRQQAAFQAQLEAALKHAIPGIATVRLQENAPRVQIRIASWQPLIPHVQSNQMHADQTSEMIVQFLAGNHDERIAEPSSPSKTAPQAVLPTSAANHARTTTRPQTSPLSQSELMRSKQWAAQIAAMPLPNPHSISQKTSPTNHSLRNPHPTPDNRVTSETAQALATRSIVQPTTSPGSSRHALASSVPHQQSRTSTSPPTQAYRDVDINALDRPAKPEAPLHEIVFSPPEPEVYNQLQWATPSAPPTLPLETLVPPWVTPSRSSTTTTPNNPASDLAPSAQGYPFRLQATPAHFQMNPSTPSPDTTDAATTPERSHTAWLTSPWYAGETLPSALQSAWQALNSGNFSGAELWLRTFLEKGTAAPTLISPQEARWAHYLLAQSLYLPGLESHPPPHSSARDAENARQELLKIADGPSSFLPALLLLIDLQLASQHESEAQRLVSDGLQRFPQQVALQHRAARILEAKHQWLAAQTQYQAILAQHPDDTEAHYRLAQVALASQQPDMARLELLQALSLNPNDDRPWQNLAQLSLKRHDAALAIQQYRPAQVGAQLLRVAQALQLQQQPKKALRLYQAVEALAEEDPELLYSLGLAYAEWPQQTKRAEQTLKRYLALHTNSQSDPQGHVAQAKNTLLQLESRNLAPMPTPPIFLF